MRDGRELLRRWATVNDRIKEWQKEIKELQELIENARDLTSMSNDGMPRNSAVSSPTETKACGAVAYAEKIDVINNKINRELEFKEQIDKIVDDLPPEQYKIVILRYKENRNWINVAMTAGYSVDWAKKLGALAAEKTTLKNTFFD